MAEQLSDVINDTSFSVSTVEHADWVVYIDRVQKTS